MGGLYRPQNASVTIERLSNIQKMSKARGDPMIHDLEGKLRHGLFCFAIPIDGEGAILTRNIVPRPRLELIRARRPGLLLDERAEDRPASLRPGRLSVYYSAGRNYSRVRKYEGEGENTGWLCQCTSDY